MAERVWNRERVAPLRVDRTLGHGGSLETLAAGFVVSPWCNFRARNVVNRFYTILYLLDGAGVYEEQGGVRYELGPGVLVQRFPGVVHTVRRSRDVPWVEFFLRLPESFACALSAVGSISTSRPVLRPGITSLLFMHIQALLRNLPHDSGVSGPQVLSEAHSLLVQLFEADRESRRGSSEDSLVRRAQEQLAGNLDRRLNMRDVARELGAGYESFRKLFRRYQGMSPKEYRIRRRIDMARHLLTVEHLSVKETAYRLGYPDTPSFCKQFSRVAGMTPARYRRGEE